MILPEKIGMRIGNGLEGLKSALFNVVFLLCACICIIFLFDPLNKESIYLLCAGVRELASIKVNNKNL